MSEYYKIQMIDLFDEHMTMCIWYIPTNVYKSSDAAIAWVRTCVEEYGRLVHLYKSESSVLGTAHDPESYVLDNGIVYKSFTLEKEANCVPSDPIEKSVISTHMFKHYSG